MLHLPKRSRSQKVGSQGHRWLMAEIEKHPHWLARSLDEDFGVDAEAEFIPGEAKGDILKLQFKTMERTAIRHGKIRITITRKYFEYARACRYPVVFVQADLERKQAWYLWLQKWILENHPESTTRKNQQSRTIWLDAEQTLEHGLQSDLQAIAQWRGPTQLALSLLDAFRAATATNNRDVLIALTQLLDTVAPSMPDPVLDDVVDRAISLGNRLWATDDGNTVAVQMFALVRQFGHRIRLQAIDAMVRRGDSYSRTGVNALGILYDQHYEHARGLKLVNHFTNKKLPQVAYFCALREAFPEKKDFDFMDGAGDFQHSGLRFYFDNSTARTGFHDKYANRGSSAILDYLFPVNIQQGS